MNRLEWQRDYRKSNGNASTKKYERTKKGKLMRTYRNMESRVKGIVKAKAHLYEGLDLLNRGDFYLWSLADYSFNKLYDDWSLSNYPIGLSPSIDREDTSVGYIVGNIRWITHSENSRLGGLKRKDT